MLGTIRAAAMILIAFSLGFCANPNPKTAVAKKSSAKQSPVVQDDNEDADTTEGTDIPNKKGKGTPSQGPTAGVPDSKDNDPSPEPTDAIPKPSPTGAKTPTAPDAVLQPGSAPAPDTIAGGKANVKVMGRQLMVGGALFNMKSVAYNPIRKGGIHPQGLMTQNPSAADLAMVEKDFQMMQAAGINTIRPYEAILDQRILALITKYQLRVIVPVLNYYGGTTARTLEIIDTLKNHPSTLIWEMGNEWNYNRLYGSEAGFSYDQAKNLIKSLSAIVKNLDPTHPTSTVYGDLPPVALINEMTHIDIWGTNVYTGMSFGDRFTKWKALSTKPLYIGEFGADAINVDKLDVNSQAIATTALINEIAQNLSSKNPANVLIGGSIFEWNDEWWKDSKGSPLVQESGGIAPGIGPYPDNIFNEEYWGIVDIERNPRPAYFKLKEAYSKF